MKVPLQPFCKRKHMSGFVDPLTKQTLLINELICTYKTYRSALLTTSKCFTRYKGLPDLLRNVQTEMYRY